MGLCLPPHGAVSLCLGPGSGGLRGFEIRHHQGHNVYLVVTKAALLFYKVTYMLSISGDHLRGVKRGTRGVYVNWIWRCGLVWSTIAGMRWGWALSQYDDHWWWLWWSSLIYLHVPKYCFWNDSIYSGLLIKTFLALRSGRWVPCIRHWLQNSQKCREAAFDQVPKV